MSETPYSAGGSDPTQRYEPAPPTSGPPSADPNAPAYSTPQWTIPPTDSPAYPPQEPPQPAPPAAPAPPPPATYPSSGPPAATYPQSGPPAAYPVPYAAPPTYGQQPTYGATAYQQPQPMYDQYGRPLSDKSKLVAGLLGIFLGGFGVGRFYTGHTGLAVGQLLVTLFTCGLGSLWGLIDGIMILVNGGTDAQGRILRD